MTKATIMLMICPHGHSFITLQNFGCTFTCPECDRSFDAGLGGLEVDGGTGDQHAFSSPAVDGRDTSQDPARMKLKRARK